MPEILKARRVFEKLTLQKPQFEGIGRYGDEIISPAYCLLKLHISMHMIARNLDSLDNLCNQGQHVESLEVMEQRNIALSRNNAYSLLSASCGKDSTFGIQVQSLMVQSGLDFLSVLGDHLIRLFASCECLVLANQAFSRISQPTTYTWNAIIFASAGRGEALAHYRRMAQLGIACNHYVHVAALKACTLTSALDYGKLVHRHIICSSQQFDVIIGNTLIDMYAKCGRLREAHIVFGRLPNLDVVSWNVMIAGYTQSGESHLAYSCFIEMQKMGIKADAVTFASILKACGCIGDREKGIYTHNQIITSGFQSTGIVGNTLVDMYFKCGCFEEAHKTFNQLPDPDIISWNALISGSSQGYLALECFKHMELQRIPPDKVTFLSIMKACASIGAIQNARHIHEKIMTGGFQFDVFVGSTLVDIHSKCGSLEEARRVFDELTTRNLVSWNAMIAGYAQHAEGLLALQCFEDMQQDGIRPDSVTFSSVVKACGSIGSIECGRIIHEKIIESGLRHQVIVGSALVDMHAKCGCLEEAQNLFEKLLNRDVVSWNAIIGGYAQHGQGTLAMDCFDSMRQEGKMPDPTTFSSIIKVCGSVGILEMGRHIHENILELKFQSDVVVGNSIMDMYMKCGSLEEALRTFENLPSRDVISWNTLIAGYAHNCEGMLALRCFNSMQQQKLLPNKVTFSSVLTACGYLGAVDNGRHIHEQIIVNDLQSDVFVGNGLVDMYTKCGRPEEAQSVFNKLLYRDVVSWNAMLAGYIEHGESMLVLECFNSMQQDGLKPNAITCLSVLKACGSIGAMEKGRYIHEQVIENGLQTDIFVGNTLVDMYVKCGSLREARKVFEELQDHGDVVSWNAIMGGYAEHGKGRLTLECFYDMQQNGVLPDSATFSAILNACRYAGLVEEGQQFLKSMRESHGIIPDMHHNNCMIDVLSREGCLNEAKFLLTQTLQPNTVGWMTLLNACRLHLSVDLGKQCFDEVISLDASCGAAYVLMASIYASNNMLKDMAQLEELVKSAGSNKEAWYDIY